MASIDDSDFPFTQLQPAFICTLNADVELGEAMQNIHEHLATWHVSGGKMFTVPGCGLPNFTAEVVKGLSCSWLQPREHRSPTEPEIMGGECLALLRIIDGPPKSVDPVVAARETGLIRLQYTALTKVVAIDIVPKAVAKLEAEFPNPADRKPIQVGGTVCQNFIFETIDPRFQFLKCYHFIGDTRVMLHQDPAAPGGFRLVGETKISYTGPRDAPN